MSKTRTLLLEGLLIIFEKKILKSRTVQPYEKWKMSIGKCRTSESVTASHVHNESGDKVWRDGRPRDEIYILPDQTHVCSRSGNNLPSISIFYDELGPNYSSVTHTLFKTTRNERLKTGRWLSDCLNRRYFFFSPLCGMLAN